MEMEITRDRYFFGGVIPAARFRATHHNPLSLPQRQILPSS